MSGMFDTKPDKAKRKLERTIKEEKARKKTRKITIIVTTIFMLLLCTALLLNSSWLRRTLPIMTIDGVSFTTTEFEYYFNSQLIEYNNWASQIGWPMPDQNRPLSRQVYDSNTGETWADFIALSAYARMQFLTGLYNDAVKNGFKLSDEQLDEIEAELMMIDMQAEYTEGITSANMLLQRIYGNSMNVSIFRSILEFVATAEEYSIHIRDSFVYTDDELDEYYKDNAGDLDVLNYRILMIAAEIPGEDTDDFETAMAQSIATAQSLAKDIESEITSEDDFIIAAYEYNTALYSDPDSTIRELQGERLDELYSAWLLGSGRASGDTTVINTEQGASVLYFLSRDKNDYNTVGMRQILILRENVNPSDFTMGVDDPEYLEALENAENETRERAQNIESLFIAAGETENALIDLMEEHSDDSTEGGFYEGISRFQYQGADFRAMRVVAELEQWLFDGRAIGDWELIETSAYGFHLIYFTGYGEKFSHVVARDRMRSAAHEDWLDSVEADEPVKRTLLFNLLVNM